MHINSKKISSPGVESSPQSLPIVGTHRKIILQIHNFIDFQHGRDIFVVNLVFPKLEQDKFSICRECFSSKLLLVSLYLFILLEPVGIWVKYRVSKVCTHKDHKCWKKLYAKVCIMYGKKKMETYIVACAWTPWGPFVRVCARRRRLCRYQRSVPEHRHQRRSMVAVRHLGCHRHHRHTPCPRTHFFLPSAVLEGSQHGAPSEPSSYNPLVTRPTITRHFGPQLYFPFHSFGNTLEPRVHNTIHKNSCSFLFKV